MHDLSNFEKVKFLGEGNFGIVDLVQNKINNQLYALKKLKRKSNPAKNEIEIVESIDYPFIIKLHKTYKDQWYNYLLFEYLPNKDLSFYLNRVNNFNEETVKFIAAIMLTTMNHLHKRNIMHRDFKSGNILLDE